MRTQSSEQSYGKIQQETQVHDEAEYRLILLNRAASIIQERWRARRAGRKAREKFRVMYSYRNAVRDLFIYLAYVFLIFSVIVARTPSKDVFMMQDETNTEFVRMPGD